VPLVFSIHAGEAFSSELNGIRRVGELYIGNPSASRIGHCLSLSASASAKIVSKRERVRISCLDALIDLCWAARAGIAGEESAEELIYRIVAPVHGSRSIPVESWMEAYPQLYSLEALERVGIVSSLNGVYRAGLIDEVAAICAAGGTVDRALGSLAYALSPPISGADLHMPLRGALLDRYVRFSVDVSESARLLALTEVRESGTTIEACPTSNIVLSGLDGYSAHPLWSWLDDGVDVSVSSDDPLMFNSSVGGEFRFLQNAKPARADLLAQAAAVSVGSCTQGERRGLSEVRSLRSRLRLSSDGAE